MRLMMQRTGFPKQGFKGKQGILEMGGCDDKRKKQKMELFNVGDSNSDGYFVGYGS